MSILQKTPYDNILMHSLNGKILGFCDKRRADWYVARNLGCLKYASPIELHLTFNPKNINKIDTSHLFFIEPRDNHCVICGCDTMLNKHHIIPSCYMVNMPVDIKEHNSYDIVSVCTKHHKNYEKHANKYKIKIGKDYGFELITTLPNTQYLKWAITLSSDDNNIPDEKKCYMTNKVLEIFKIPEITKEIVDNLVEKRNNMMKWKNENTQKGLIDYLINKNRLDEFFILWRNHFIEFAKPKHMPKSWRIDAPIKLVRLK